MADLLLLIDISAPGGFPQLCFLFRIGGVIAGEGHDPSVVQLDDFCDDAIQKIPVVGNDQNGTFVVDQVVFQPCDGI